MASIIKKRKELRNELTLIEKQIYDLETNYLEETKEFGNIFTGWSGYLSQDKVKTKKNISSEDRLFSLSSITSPAARRDEAKNAISTNESPTKKNKRIKIENDQEVADEDLSKEKETTATETLQNSLSETQIDLIKFEVDDPFIILVGEDNIIA